MDNEIITEETANVVLEEAPKRRRGRPRKVNPEQAATFTETTEDKPKTRRGRRSAKLTGDDIVKIVTQSSGYFVALSGRKHWQVGELEVVPWADQAADMLNRIPTRYVKAATDFSGYLTVGIGIYAIVKPRLDFERQLAEQARTQAEQERVSNGIEHASPNDAQIPLFN